MKHITAVMLFAVFGEVFAAPNPVATHLWTTNKINEIVGTNTAAQIASSTNATLAAANAYTDASIAGAGSVSPQIVTNIVDAKIAAIPKDGVSTNAVNFIIREAVRTNYLATVEGSDARYRGVTNLAYHIETGWTFSTKYPLDQSIARTIGISWNSDPDIASGVGWYVTSDGWECSLNKGSLSSVELTWTPTEWGWEETEDAGNITFRRTLVDDNIALRKESDYRYAPTSTAVTVSNLSQSLATKADAAAVYTKTQSDAAYYPKASGEAWSSYWDGDDVRVTVTNYDSATSIPSLYLEQRTNTVSMSTNLFKVVWREMAHWERFLGTNWNWASQWDGFKEWADNIATEIGQKADRAWGFYDSHTGRYAPDGYTSVSSSNVIICAGASYQKTLTTAGEVWVLTANDTYEPTGVSTNGGFQIKDHEGHVQFEIVKGDKTTVKAQANAVTVENGTTLVVTYNIIAGSPPTGEVCLDLANPTWKTETAADCPATVVWSGSSGAYVARITPTGAAATKCFFKATYQSGGETYIKNHCAVGMSQIVLNGTTYNLGTATISGNTVLTLTPTN